MNSSLNVEVFRSINDIGFTYPGLDPIFIILAKYTIILLFLIMLFFWFWKRQPENRMMIISGVVAFVIGTILARICGQFYSNFQPFAELQNVNQLVDHNVDNSFPSDHSMLFFAICTTFWLYKKPFRWLWILFALIVAISRITVGVHYPLDVLVGGIVGIISAYIAFKWVPRIRLVNKGLEIYEGVENKILGAGK